MIDLSVNPEGVRKAAARARDRGVLLPTLAQQRHPELVPAPVREKLAATGLWDVDPVNLFRITWKNDPVPSGGAYGAVNAIEFPPELTGTPARIIALVGKWFPTGAHKVGATYGCLAPALVTGRFDAARQKAVWPSTGNFCRGGAYNAALLGCESVAILPEGMSRERFEWLSRIAGEVIATPGSESNVKEIFDACHVLRRERGDAVMIFNQFEEEGNHLWHYAVTGAALEEVVEAELGPRDVLRGFVSATGSAGTIAAGDYLKQRFSTCRIAAAEALQCPTLLQGGYGSHRIEGIGDKHVPWIHNVRNTDLVVAVDDEACMSLLRLFNEPQGRRHLAATGVAKPFLDRLDLVGISGAANLVASVKLARWYGLGPNDLIVTVLTDSMELYGSRIEELRAERGAYAPALAAADHARWLLGADGDHMLELTEPERRRIHNLKYFTWVEQQGKTVEELDAQWDDPDHWTAIQGQADALDELILEFNRASGLAGA